MDSAGTRLKNFQDKRSFVSLDGHEYLYGKDKTARYKEMVESVKPFCANCGIILFEGELHHIKSGLVGQCDCKHNLQWLCWKCHRAKHVQILSRKEMEQVTCPQCGDQFETIISDEVECPKCTFNFKVRKESKQ